MGKIMGAVKQMSSMLNCWGDIVRKFKKSVCVWKKTSVSVEEDCPLQKK